MDGTDVEGVERSDCRKVRLCDACRWRWRWRCPRDLARGVETLRRQAILQGLWPASELRKHLHFRAC
ncbi:hypothetical protein [Jiella pelagia]|uniref:Transposase n=1 Tax=Jiella pelagia TaxID=2986949 RepID=A0ABY7C4Y7_9HYPH|nr:hypothetical protein [Jiella pelagia]WAP70811.1 hypothetical protein OH818_12890 [Jiella pelagia]